MTKASSERAIPLRIVVVAPPAGVSFAVQSGRDQLLSPSGSAGGDLWFDVSVRAVASGAGVRLLGTVVQGPPSARFVYVTSGRRGGQHDSCWTRRAKVPLGGITPAQLDAVARSPGRVLVARIAGTARDGGPACASVPLLDDGWCLGSR